MLLSQVDSHGARGIITTIGNGAGATCVLPYGRHVEETRNPRPGSAVLVWAADPSARSTLPRLKVSDNKRFLVTSEGKPFFYLAGTGWELFHLLDREQAVEYLDKRAAQHDLSFGRIRQ